MTSQLQHFDTKYRSEEEPWSFSGRAAEVLRHEWLVATARNLAPRRMLDLGCSLGQLTRRLSVIPTELFGMDISPTAVTRARARSEPRPREAGAPVSFSAGSATSLPIASDSFDLVVASDGLYSWEIDAAERQQALREIHRILRRGGHALLTEHTRPERFSVFVDEVRASPLRVESVSYLYDRPWYQFESWLKAVQHWGAAKALKRNLALARALCGIGRMLGQRGARHVCVIAVRDA